MSWNGREVWTSTGGEGTSTPLDLGDYELFDLRAVDDAFVGVIIDRPPAQQHDTTPSRWGSVSSPDAVTWTVEQEGLTTPPPQVVLKEGSLCIAFGYTEVLSGEDCDSLEVTYTDGELRPLQVLHAGDVYLVSGMHGILSSRDGMSWSVSLGDP